LFDEGYHRRGTYSTQHFDRSGQVKNIDLSRVSCGAEHYV